MRFTPDVPPNITIFFYTQRTASPCANFIRKRLSGKVRRDIAGVGASGLVPGCGLDKHWGLIISLKLQWLTKRFRPDWTLSGKDRVKAECPRCGLKKSWIINVSPVECPECYAPLDFIEVYKPRRKTKKTKVKVNPPAKRKIPYHASYRDGKPRAVPREHRW